MTIDLSKVTFDNDFFFTDLPDGSALVLNKVNESFVYEESSTTINTIIVLKIDSDGNQTECSSIIGLSLNGVTVKTDYTEYSGKCLTEENMIYCTIEVEE